MQLAPDSKRFFALAFVTALLALIGSIRTGISAAGTILISEVHPGGSSNPAYAADWFEVSNIGGSAINISGWKIDDSSPTFGTAVALRGITSIPAGSSVVFLEANAAGTNDATIKANFSSAWFGPTPPAGLLLGTYGGSGIGLSTGGDAVNLFDSGGNIVASVSFGTFPVSTPVKTFDNAAGLDGVAISTLSSAGTNSAFLSFNGAEVGSPGYRAPSIPLTNIDLSTYVRVGRFDLPEPTRTAAPPHNLLAQEASAVTYNWDTDTLFVVGDGSTAIAQVSKTGQLIDTMTLAQGGSPQGTEFYDTEGLTYVGGGRFVMAEERNRRVVLFTYAANTTLTRADTLTVTLGTFADNMGFEGLSYDPLTGGFIIVKETQPEGIFQTGIDFAAGTATNGSPTTENSVDLFTPTLANLLDFADVYALSNITSLTGSERSHILILSQESGKIVHVDRDGNIYNALTIAADPSNPLDVPGQQHEGMTMDFAGNLYVVSENGGGSVQFPQLWVYSKSLAPNLAPTAVVLFNQVNSLAENTSTVSRLKVADVAVTDDGLGVNNLTVSGLDAAAFEVDNTGLFIKAGAVLDFETKSSYSITVEVDDPGVGLNVDASVNFSLTLTDVAEGSPSAYSLVISEVAPWGSGATTPYAADWFEVRNTGVTPVDIAGWKMDDDSNSFGSAVQLNGVSVIAPDEAVIFMEVGNADFAATRTAFLNGFFGAAHPAGLQIGNYFGGGVGLGTGGDNVNLFDAIGNRITGVHVGVSTTGVSFDNAAGIGSATLPLPTIATLSVAGVNGAFLGASPGAGTGSPGTVAANVIVSEVAPWGSASTTGYAADWFEITNVGNFPVSVSGWKMDDDSNAFAQGAPLRGVTLIPAGRSAVFFEGTTTGSTDDAIRTAFANAWAGTPALPAGFLIGAYGGGGVGLSTGGDQVNLFDSAGHKITGVRFGSSSGTVGFSFDNSAGIGSATLSPPPLISTLSVTGVNGAFLGADGFGTGSPGSISGMSDLDADGFNNADESGSAGDPPGNVIGSIPLNFASTPEVCDGADNDGNEGIDEGFPDTDHDGPKDCVDPDVDPPAIDPSPDLVFEANGIGTVVTFASPATHDDFDGDGVATCLPASGSLFPLGVTTVTCSAQDAAGNFASSTFTVTIQVTSGGLQNLVTQFVTNPDVARGLNDKLQAAANAQNADARAGQLNAFRNQLSAQTGKSITAAQAEILLALLEALY